MPNPPAPLFRYQPILLALGFALLVGVAGISMWLVQQTRSDAEQAIHALEIKEQLASLQGLVWRAESHQRSLLLSGEPSYGRAFRDDAEAVRLALSELEAASAGSADPERSSLLARLSTAIDAELASLEGDAARGRLTVPAALPAETNANTAQALSPTEEVRALIAQLLQQEQHLLTGEMQASNERTRLLLIASLAGATIIAVLAAGSIAMVHRSTAQLLAAQGALRQTNESLEETVARRTAELRQANEEIQNFAYVVSHDLRAPLVNIMGFTGELEAIRKDLLERRHVGVAGHDATSAPEDQLGRDFDEALHFIKTSIGRMDRLIKSILKLTREGRREFRLEPIDMTGSVRSIADGLGYQAHAVGASIEIEELPPLVGDRLAIEQIFGNLLDNALKYLRQDVPGRIVVSGLTTASGLIYEVRDNGRGIEAKDQARIFEIFRRSGAQDQPGEGIGLTHVRTLVSRLGGTITVQSQPGQGSIFRVTLPSRQPASSGEPVHE
ncbi:sensor histidine kinase [Devosia nitrariae]|nr:ATP-binding protein [Devosia nitrariae]